MADLHPRMSWSVISVVYEESNYVWILHVYSFELLETTTDKPILLSFRKSQEHAQSRKILKRFCVKKLQVIFVWTHRCLRVLHRLILNLDLDPRIYALTRCVFDR